MGGKRTELIVGLVGLLALVILVAGLIFLREYQFGLKNYVVHVVFDTVAGLKKGDPVMVAGVRKGSAESLTLKDGRVWVELHLHGDVQLSDDAKVTVASSGFVGLKYVDVQPGQSGRPLDISRPVQGHNQTDVFEVIGQMGDLISEVRHLVAALDSSMTGQGLLFSIQEAMADARILMRTMQSLVEENRSGFTGAIEDFKATSQQMRELVEGNRASVDSSVVLLNDSAERTQAILNDLEEVSASFKGITEQIDRGEGTLGQLVKNRDLYDELQKTSRDVNLLIEDIKKNPGKYFKFSVIDF